MSRESLDMSRAMDRHRLEIPKFVRESLYMGRKSLETSFTDFCDPCLDLIDQILACPDFRDPRRDSCPDFCNSYLNFTDSNFRCG